ncbi:MAG: polya polymerase [Desulfopila sp.]
MFLRHDNTSCCSPPLPPNTMSGTTTGEAVTPHPLIISQDSHPIEQRSIDKDALFVMRKLNKAGFSSYLVGGGVRDLYLGKTPKDFDISTDARPGQIRKLFPNSATIGRRFRLVQVFFKNGKVIEVSTLRSLSEHDLDGPEAVLAPNNTFGKLSEDAQRRDLTINALFFELENNTIIDYIGGVRDLDNSIIRMVGEPSKRINRDPVRMLRAIRHSAGTGFTIDATTWNAICVNRAKLNLCPPSRIRDEILKDLYGGAARQWLNLAIDSATFFTLFPFYQHLLQTSTDCREQLTTIFSILDRAYNYTRENNTTDLPYYFTLALLTLPWAEATYNLSQLHIKGPALFQLSKKLRHDIDIFIGIPLNLRKSLRQEIVTLLSSTPQFVRFVQDGRPPKWLTKKSYYSRCSHFYNFHRNILTGQNCSAEIQGILEKSRTERPHLQKVTEIPTKKTSRHFHQRKKVVFLAFANRPTYAPLFSTSS